MSELLVERDRLTTLMTSNPLYGVTSEEVAAGRRQITDAMIARAHSKAGVDVYRDALMAGEEGASASLKAMEFLRKTFETTDLALPSSKRDGIIGDAMRQIRAMETERKAQERELSRELSDARRDARADISDQEDVWGESLRAGVQAPQAALDALSVQVAQYGTPAQRLRLSQIIQLNEAVKPLNGMTLAQMEASVGEVDARAATDFGVARIAQDYRAAVGNRIQAVKTHPATVYARMNGEETPPVNWAKPETEELSEYFDYTDKAADAFGVAPKYFSPAQRQFMMAVSDAGGDGAIAYYESLARAAGPERASKVFAEIGSMGATALGFAGSVLAGGGDPQISRYITKGAEYRKVGKTLRADLPADDRKRVFDETARPALLGASADSIKGIEEAASLAFEGMAQERGVTSRDDAKRLYQAAVDGVLGRNGEWGGPARAGKSMVVAPPWVKAGQLGNLIGAMTGADWARAGIAGPPGAAKDWQGKPAPASVDRLRGAWLVQVANGQFKLSETNPANGRPVFVPSMRGGDYVLDLNLMRNVWTQRRSDAVR